MVDRKLVKRAKKGDKEALLELIMLQKDDYYKLAYSYMGNKDDALDAMEDMIVKLYEKIHQLKKDDSFYSWSKTILVNCCHTILRTKKRIVYMEDYHTESPTHLEKSQYTSAEQQMDIKSLLSMLNPNQAEAIQLKYLNDMDYQSIAEVTNTSIGTVKSRIFQGLKKLNNLYGGVEHE